MTDLEKNTYRRIEKVRSAEWLSFTNLAFHCGIGETEMRELTKRADFPLPSSPTGSEKLRRWSKQEVNEWMVRHKLESVSNV